MVSSGAPTPLGLPLPLFLETQISPCLPLVPWCVPAAFLSPHHLSGPPQPPSSLELGVSCLITASYEGSERVLNTHLSSLRLKVLWLTASQPCSIVEVEVCPAPAPAPPVGWGKESSSSGASFPGPDESRVCVSVLASVSAQP